MKQFAYFNFESFVPCAENPVPNVRIMEFITIGPFVLKTTGSFEYEHMYARDKLLLEDYLAPDGGERTVLPAIGKKQKNNYYGPEYLEWKKGFIKWNSLRFDAEGDACDDALFATEQRNAVYYAGFYVDCEKPSKAVIAYDNSGSSLFLNGELIDFKPFGRVKGLYNMGYACPVTFRQGRNLVLFKMRPGYIADTMDLSVEKCAIYPVIGECGGVGITLPTKTLAFTGSKEEPAQVFPFYACTDEGCGEAVLKAPFGQVKIPAMDKGSCSVCRISVPSGSADELKKVPLTLECGGESASAEMYFDTNPYDGFEGKEYIFSDFHFDTTYHQEQRTYALGAFHITKCIVDNLIENPDFKATLSEVDYLHPYFTLYPSHRNAIREAFSSGRAEADCFYNQANDLTSSGEAFVRNLTYGQLYHRDVLGRICSMYVPGDVFGHFSQISQVCAKGGVKTMRWGKAMMGVDQLFRHVSPDGTVMLHDKGIIRPDANRFGVKGCAHSSEALDYIEAIPRTGNTDWMKETVSNARFGVFSELSETLLESDRELTSSGREFLIDYTSRDLTQHHSGVLLTRTDFKQANRLCENLLITAEKFASVSFLYGAKYPDDALDKAWRQLLTAQHHDSITGTNNEISFVDLMIEYRECAILAADIVKKSAEYIASLTDCRDRDRAVFVFNPVTRDSCGPCSFEIPVKFRGKALSLTDTKGRKYPVTVNGNKGSFYSRQVPAMGYTVYRIEEEATPAEVACGNDNVIENDRFVLTVDRNHGGIISLYDKTSGRECIDRDAKSSANAIWVMREIHDRMETQHEIYTTGQKLVSDEYSCTIRSEKCGEYEKLIIRNKLDTIAAVIREITLFRTSDKVDFRTVVEDYNSEDDLFSVTFPVNIKGGAVLFDDRFAPHVSTRSKKFMSFQTHQYASFSGCRILPSGRWFGIGPSVTVSPCEGSSFNMGMTAVIRKNNPGLCTCSKNLLIALSKKAVPVTIYPDTKQRGGLKIVHFNEDIYETDTRIVLSVAGDEDLYTGKLLSLLSAEQKKAADRQIGEKGIAFIYMTDSDNAWSKPVDTVLIIGKTAEDIEKYITSLSGELKHSSAFTLPSCIMASPCARSDDFGAELINNGTIACSVEGESTLNMMLFHTASFYGNAGKVTGGRELVPEDKTHIFTYEFYPHSGSYRQADTCTEAARFNEPLFAVTDTGQRKALLPEEKFFLRCSGGFEITAFKAGGYPLASLKKAPLSPKERGFAVRGWETAGEEHGAEISFGFEAEKIRFTDLLEENPVPGCSDGQGVEFGAKPYSIETLTFAPKSCSEPGGVIIGAEKEMCEPVYVRSWDHDMGAVAMGNLSFAATLDRKPVSVCGNTTVIAINAVNNTSDETIAADMIIECSEGFSADLKSVRAELGPLESRIIPLTVTSDSEGRQGQIRILYSHGGREFTDVYEFGYFNPEVHVRIDGSSIICTVTNPTDQYLEGTLNLATPIETWGEECMNPCSFGSVMPLSRQVSLAPQSECEYEFTVETEDTDFFKAYYAAAKLCCNGRIHFGFASVHGPRHNVWAHEFINVIHNDGGSIQKLLDM